MAQVIQVEIRSGTTHTVTWLDAALKPKEGMALACKGDERRWTVVHVYSITAQKVKDNNVSWKVCALDETQRIYTGEHHCTPQYF
jgi:hypothetical protein